MSNKELTKDQLIKRGQDALKNLPEQHKQVYVNPKGHAFTRLDNAVGHTGVESEKDLVVVSRGKVASSKDPEPKALDKMTKAELQAYAEENEIEGVNKDEQTKAEMIKVIEAAEQAEE